MRKGWEAKRQLATGISSPQVDLAIERALEAGASGAKLTGAGGGGFLLASARSSDSAPFARAWRTCTIAGGPDRFGSRVVLNVQRDIWG